MQHEGESRKAHGEARTARGQTNMGDGHVARVARWLATLKASVKLVPLGRRGKCNNCVTNSTGGDSGIQISSTRSRTRTLNACAILTSDPSEASMFPRSTSPIKLW